MHKKSAYIGGLLLKFGAEPAIYGVHLPGRPQASGETMMNTTPQQRPSAKIYQFPMRNRAQPAKAEARTDIQDVVALPKIAAAALDGAWYHEAAVEKNGTGARH
jgi:hypothetical protein